MNGIINYTIEEIAKYTGGQLINHNKNALRPVHISLDSRKIISAATTVFFAIKTSGHDANVFIEGLYARGVRNFVTSDKKIDLKKIPLANVILVKDPVFALQQLAIHYRRKFPELRVIGITGSNGKTIVKEWLNQLLEADNSIVRSPKSYNSQIGVPLSVLNIQPSHNLAIFEAGISRPGEMEKLEKIIRPAIGILTNIGRAHDESFKNLTQKIHEKLQLFIHTSRLVYGTDNPGLKKAVQNFHRKINARKKFQELFSWGKDPDNTLQIISVNKKKTYTKIDAVYEGETLSISIPFVDDASVENAVNCWCVLLLLNRNTEETRKRFEALYPIAMRLEVKQGVRNCTLINDSYSNDIQSLEIALNFLEQQKQHKNHTIILSDILQSGKKPEELYREVASLIQHKKVKRLIGIGRDICSQQATFSFLKGKQFFLTVEDFLKNFESMDFHEETVLIKGARIFGFEKIGNRLEQKAHHTQLSINLNAIVHNQKVYKSFLRHSTRIMAMVKAFSYGSGSYEIASILEYNKVDYLAVAYADEGVDLRRAGITLPIMVMNAEPDTFESLVNYSLEPEIFSVTILNDFENFLKSNGVNSYPVHIKIDTGMHRLGFTSEDMNTLCMMLMKNAAVKVVSVFTHLVAAENEKEDAFTKNQSAIFIKCCEKIRECLGYKFIQHVSNTAGVSRHPQLQMDMVRLGIGLYGIDSNEKIQSQLRNVTTLTSTVSQIKKVTAGDSVGYGRKARLSRNSVIATVRIGYADGYPRNLGNGNGRMRVNGFLAPVIGNVCMDMTMLDITDLEGIEEGDEVIVFGENLPLTMLAAWAQTIPYEIMTGISQRVKRVYFEE